MDFGNFPFFRSANQIGFESCKYTLNPPYDAPLRVIIFRHPTAEPRIHIKRRLVVRHGDDLVPLRALHSPTQNPPRYGAGGGRQSPPTADIQMKFWWGAINTGPVTLWRGGGGRVRR